MEGVKGYTLVNTEKVERALNGVQVQRDGRSSIIGGVGKGAYFEDEKWKRDGVELVEKDVTALEDALLAEYDRLGGLIKRGEDIVKTGSFYDFKARTPLAKPHVVFQYRINGELVDVPEDAPEPIAVKASKLQTEAKKKKNA